MQDNQKIISDQDIKIHNLTVVYRGIPVLWEINSVIKKGMLTAIVGPNGAGKSTLLQTLLGLKKPRTGSIKLGDQNLIKMKDKGKYISYVPQRESIDWDFPISCIDVVKMPLTAKLSGFKRTPKEYDDLALEYLEKFEMALFKDRQIGKLSGGQRQRIFLARSLIQNTEYLILDEPFGGIDAKTERMTLELLTELKEKGKTIVVVTHDLSSISKYFDEVILLNTQVVAQGKPEAVLTKENLKVAYGSFLHLQTEMKNESNDHHPSHHSEGSH